MGSCCARRRVPGALQSLLCGCRAESAVPLCEDAFSFKMPRGVPQGRCRGVQSEAADEDCRAWRRGPKDLFVNNSAGKAKLFDKLELGGLRYGFEIQKSASGGGIARPATPGARRRTWRAVCGDEGVTLQPMGVR